MGAFDRSRRTIEVPASLDTDSLAKAAVDELAAADESLGRVRNTNWPVAVAVAQMHATRANTFATLALLEEQRRTNDLLHSDPHEA